MLEKIKPEEIDRIITEGYSSYEEYKEILKRPDEPIRRSKRTDVEGEIIIINKNTSIYDKNIDMVMDRIIELIKLDCVTPIGKGKRKLKVKEIYIILNKKYVDITLDKTKELYRYAKNSLGL